MHWIIYVIIGFIVLTLLPMAIKIVAEYERGVTFRLGRLIGAKGPGLFLIIPFIDRVVKVDLRVVTMDIPSVEVVTRDSVNVQADVTIKFKVVDPIVATIKVLDHIQETSQASQAALRNLLIQSARNELVPLDKVSETLQRSIDKETRTWGVEMVEVELKKMTFT